MKALFMSIVVAIMLPQVGQCQKKSVTLPVTSEKYTLTSFFEGKEFYTEFTEKDVSNTPSWNPENEKPPISVSKALGESRKLLGKYVPNSNIWEIESIKYEMVGKDKWVYVIDFYLDRLSTKDGNSATFSAVLKMDGTFFEPKVTALDKH